MAFIAPLIRPPASAPTASIASPGSGPAYTLEQMSAATIAMAWIWSASVEHLGGHASRDAELGLGRVDSTHPGVIQTAQPLAHATGVKLSVEDGLAEFGHTHGTIPPAPRRYAVASFSLSNLKRQRPLHIDA